MRKFLLAVALCVIPGLAFAQGPLTPGSGSNLTSVAGVFDSTKYIYGGNILSGNSATGSQTIVVCPAYVTLPDGRVSNVWANNVPITVDPQNSTAAETVTPSAVSVNTSPGPGSSVPCENITATFSNTHGASQSPAQVISGDQGIQECINDAQNASYTQGPSMCFWVIDPGIVTLSTGGANTNLGAVKIPVNSVVMSATARVTTTIATCAGGWSLGWSSGTDFTSANTTLTAGTTTDSSTTTLPAVVGTATIPINKCTTSNASAGKIHARFSGYKLAAPAN